MLPFESQMAANPAPERRIARLEVRQLHAMLEAGILAEGEPVELIDGVLVYKDRSALGEDAMTIGHRHNLVVKLLARLDAELASHGCHMQTQGPLSLPPHDEPEPDGAILLGDPRTYGDRLPAGADCTSVIEVADASLVYDRTRKLAVYARAGIPQYVIVDLQNLCAEVHEGPVPREARYGSFTVVRPGDSLRLRTAKGSLEVEVTGVLP